VKKSSTVAALDLVGYTLLDIHLGEIGKVKEVVENQFQSLLIVEHPSGEKMVPLVEELIKGIDEENLILHMELPEGLLDIGN
jgi:16S rRNA processing protein RimM